MKKFYNVRARSSGFVTRYGSIQHAQLHRLARIQNFTHSKFECYTFQIANNIVLENQNFSA